MTPKRIILGSPVGFIESLKRWLGLSGTANNQLPFGPLEIGDVLAIDSGGKAVGTIKVIGVPSLSNRPLGAKLPKGKKYPSVPLPPDERKTGFYTFFNIDVQLNGEDRPFQALYDGKRLTCYGRAYSYVYGIREIRQTSGKVLRARFKHVRPSWTRLSPRWLNGATRVSKAE